MLKKFSIIVSFVFLASFVAFSFAKAQNDTSVPAPAGEAEEILDDADIKIDSSLPSNTVNCFDYYKFGSVQVPVTSNTLSTVSGTTMSFTGSIKNENSYPIVDGKVIVKIFRKQKEWNANGPYVVDQFVAKNNINIGANSKQKIDFTWKVPAYAKSGDYQVATFFTSADKFNLLGLTFTDDIIGNTFDFKVKGDQEKLVEFDKNSVKINGSQYYFAAFPPSIEVEKDGVLTANLINETDKTQEVKVTWKTYYWDAEAEKNLLNTKTEIWTLAKGEKKNLSYTVTDKTHSVYLVVAEVKYKDTKSIMGVRFTRIGVDIPRINFPAVTSFPLTKGTPTTLFSCLHNTNYGNIKNGSLSLKLEDQNGKIIQEYKYDGSITSAMMAVKKDFTPSKNYDNFSIIAELSQGGKVVDSAKMTYNCKDIDASKCFPVSNNNTLTIIIISTIILLLCIILYFAIRKREHKVVVGVGLLMIFAIGSLYMVSNNKQSIAEAPTYDGVGGGSVKWSYTETKYLLANGTGDPGGKPNKLYDVLKNTTFQVAYNVTASKPSGSTLLPGNSIRFTFEPHSGQDVTWNGTGGSFDTPYGYWVTSDVGISEANACNIADVIPNPGTWEGWGTCGDSTNSLNGQSCVLRVKEGPDIGGSHKRLFGSLNVITPVKSLVNTAGLSCGPLTSGGYIDCTVSPVGTSTTINPTFSFAPTVGKFYTQWKYARTKSPETSPWCRVGTLPVLVSASDNSSQYPLPPTFSLNVPAQTIPYTYTVSPASDCTGNTTPTNLVVTVPPNIIAGSPATITFSVSDTVGDAIIYQIDWGNGVITDVNTSTYTKTWTNAGTITIKVRAVDSCGGATEWTTLSIVVNPSASAVFSVSCSANPVNIGQPATLTATPLNYVGDVSYVWSANPSVTSNTVTIPGTSNTAIGTYLVSTVKGTDDYNSASSTTDCYLTVLDPNAGGGGTIPPVSSDCYLDGEIIASGTSRTFYSSRIAKDCNWGLIECKDGNLNGDTDTFKFKKCVEPTPREF